MPDLVPLQWGLKVIGADKTFAAGIRGGGERPATVAILDTGACPLLHILALIHKQQQIYSLMLKS